MFVAAALALTAPHLLARPHVLALPLMVAWVGGLIAGRGPPRRAVVLAAAADGAVGQSARRLCPWPRAGRADRARCGPRAPMRRARKSLALRWAAFAVAALARELLHALWLEFAAGVAKNSRARRRAAADHGMAAGGFLSVGPFEVCLLLGFGLALYRGITLPPLRIVLLLGLLHMALTQSRAASKPWRCWCRCVLATPAGEADRRRRGCESERCSQRGVLFGGPCDRAVPPAPLAYASMHRFEPHTRGSPVAAVAELKKLNLSARVQRLRFRRLSDRQRRRAVHRRPHRTVRREILCRSQRCVRV